MMPQGTPTQIGRYQIVAELGRGGFGRVYRAFDPKVGRSVAIKILTEASPDIVSRFRNEATVAGNLHHENIVTVYEYGEHEGRPFLVMEYLDGEDLQHIIASRKPLTLLQKCNIMSQAAEGFYCAHRNGVVHRDVKPANIMVLPDGSVKIMDFGIARLTHNRDVTRLTQQGLMVGTLLYMAPEQFSGSDVDALCDIFAYGLIYYELLTGKHPFDAADSRALMYKMSFEEPPPIRNFISDFPDSLQRVIDKTIQKDRELRYQSLREVQFDTEPIRLDLQRADAAKLLVEAQDRFQRKELDGALKVVLEVLSLDPANREARSLWETLQKQIQKRTVQPRLEALLRAGDDAMARRQFADAVQSFETALRLDRDNPEIQGRLDQARSLFDRGKKAARALADAQHELDRKNLTAAYRSASEALLLDPQNVEASALLENVRQAMEVRQRELRIDEAVNRAESLLYLNNYDEASALLAGLGADAESPKVQQVLARIREEKQKQDRALKLRSEMAAASDLLRERRLAEALERLESLKKDFPENQEVVRMLAYAQLELETQARAAAIEKTAGDVKSLIEINDFENALTAIEDALNKYPGEGSLIRLYGSAMSAKADWEKQQAIQSVLEECVGLRAQKRYADLTELLESTLRDYSFEPSLTALLHEIEKEWAQYRRTEAVRKAAQEARALLDQKQPERALQLLRQALADIPDEPVLLDLLSRATQEVRALEKARAVERIRQEAASLANAQDYDKALAVLDQALKTWSDDGTLVKQREAVQSAKSNWERQRAIDAAVSRANQLEADQRFEAALDLVRKSLREYPAEPALVQLEGRISKAWDEHKRREAVRNAASQATLLISNGSLDEAAEMLKQATQKYPGEPDLEMLVAQARDALRARERAADIEKRMRESNDLVTAREFDRAREVIEQGLRMWAGDGNLLRQLEAITAARAAWQREQLIRQIVEQAAELAKVRRFDDALQLLAKAAKGYKDEAALVEAQRQIERDKQEHLRREAVAKAAADAEGILARGDPEKALKLIRDVSARYPGEKEWDPLLARAEEALQARKRAEERARAIQAVVRGGNELATRGRFAEALQLADQALEQHGVATELVALKEGLQRGWEQQKRAEAIARTAETAQASIDQGRLGEAVESLRKASQQYPGEKVLESLLARAEAEIEARRIRDEAARESEARLADGRFEDVITKLQPVLARFPGDQELQSLLARAKDQLAARLRAEAIESLAQEAHAQSTTRNFDRALELIAGGLKNWPGEERLLRLQQTTLARKASWQREQALREAIRAAESLGRAKRYSEGLKYVDEALQQHPDAPSLLQLRKEFRMRKALLDADGLLNKSQPQEALRVLEESASEYVSKPEVAALMDRAHEQLRVLARQAAIEATVRDARTRADAGDLDGALAIAEEGLQTWPDAGSLIQLRDALLSAKAIRQRQEAIQDVVRRCEAMENDRRLETAIQLAEESLRQFPDETVLLDLNQKLEYKLREEKRLQEFRRDLEEMRSLAGELRKATGPARVAELREVAQGIAARYPDRDEIRAANEAITKVFSDLDTAQNALANRSFGVVLEICNRYAVENPSYAVFEKLRERALRAQKLDYLEDLQHRADTEPDLEVRVRILESGLAQYPDEKKISDDLRFTRNKLELVQSIVARARAAEKAQQWDEALEHWKSLTAIYDRYPGLAGEIQRVQSTRDGQRSEAVSRWVDQIEAQLGTGNLAKAEELLRRAQTDCPEAPTIRDLARRLKDLRQKRKRARELVSQAQSALSGDWPRSEELLNEARSLHPEVSAPEALLKAIAERKRDGLVSESLSKAARLQGSGDVRGALAEVEGSLASYPDESRLNSLKVSLTEQAKAERDRQVSQLEAILQSAPTLVKSAEIEPLRSRVQSIAAEYAGDTELRALADETARNLLIRKKQLQRTHLRGVFRAARKWIAGAAIVLVSAAAVWFGLAVWNNRPQVTIYSTPPEAAITVAGKNYVTPTVLRLRPGTYVLTAQRVGYLTVTLPLTISSRQSNEDLTVNLAPMPQAVEVNTNFVSGTVTLDGRPAGELRDGQFGRKDLPRGEHTIRVTGGNAQFEAKFQTEPGAPPQLLPMMTTKDVQAVLLSHMGATGTIQCSCPFQAVTIDGVPAGAGDGSGSPVSLTNLKEGTHQIAIGGRTIIAQFQPNPALTVSLTLDRDVGTLVVLSSEEGAKIYLNGQLHPRPTDRGGVRIALPVGAYTVRVEKDGFQPSQVPPVNVLKGQEIPTRAELKRLQAFLEIIGAQAGTQVKVDGQTVITNSASDKIQLEVPLGTHSVDVSKDGYLPVRLVAQFTAGTTQRQIGMIPVPPPQPDPDPALWAAIDKTKPGPLQSYLDRYPNGQHAQEARNLIEGLAWTSTDKTKAADLQNYVRQYPNGPHVQEARNLMEGIARRDEEAFWNSLDKGKVDELQRYLDRHSNGQHAPDARNLIDGIKRRDEEAFWNSLDKTKAGPLQSYLDRYPKGQYAEEARNLIDEMKFWDSLDKTKISDLQTYLRQYPDDAHSAEARDLVARLSARINDEQAISKTIADYEAAYNRMDLPTLLKIWPSMSPEATRRQFADAREIMFRLQRTGQININGNTALVDGTRSTGFKSKSTGQNYNEQHKVKVILNRAGSGWLIQRIDEY